ncbi:MAG TPA: flagellar basal body-associated FliL family protein [Gammaproteobacteria bacterium]|nr:flagellar basal body-associated FliL family protein [Gammaproteobacteria bacterium]
MAKKEEKPVEEEGSSKSGMGKILILGLGGLLIIGISVGAALYFTGFFDSNTEPVKAAQAVGKANTATEKVATTPKKPTEPAQYMNLRPFTVSLNGKDGRRFLQITVSLMARSSDVLGAVKRNRPAVRNALTLLFSSQSEGALSSREGKLALQKQALAEIRKILLSEGVPSELKAIYFTNFVVD